MFELHLVCSFNWAFNVIVHKSYNIKNYLHNFCGGDAEENLSRRFPQNNFFMLQIILVTLTNMLLSWDMVIWERIKNRKTLVHVYFLSSISRPYQLWKKKTARPKKLDHNGLPISAMQSSSDIGIGDILDFKLSMSYRYWVNSLISNTQNRIKCLLFCKNMNENVKWPMITELSTISGIVSLYRNRSILVWVTSDILSINLIRLYRYYR